MKPLKIHTRIKAIIVFITIIAACAVGIVVWTLASNNHELQATTEEESIIALSSQINTILNNNIIPATTLLQTIIDDPLLVEAYSNGQFASVETGVLKRQWLSHIKNFRNLQQLRLLNSEGMEVFRAEKESNNIVWVESEKLQNKSNRYYFRDALKHDEKIYVSKLDLNIESGQVEYPLRPTLRFSKTLYSNDQLIGVVVLNFDKTEMMENFNVIAQSQPFWLINQSGYHVVSPDGYAWGWQLDIPENYAKVQPADLWQTLQNIRDNDFVISIEDNFNASRIYLSSISQGSYFDDQSFYLLQPSNFKADQILLYDTIYLAVYLLLLIILIYSAKYALLVFTQLEHMKDQALKSERFKTDFLSNMSHEIRTPMNGVLGMANLLADSNLDRNQKEQLNILQSCSESMMSLINDILDIAKIESGKLKLEKARFNMNVLVENLVTLFKPIADKKGIYLQFEEDGKYPCVLGDERRIQQVLTNLISNAIKFTEYGGVRIILSGTPNDAKYDFIISVKDTGIGMSTEQQTRVFNRFEQADSSTTRMFGGTGLGLSICLELVTLMEGELNLKSALTKGSVFNFTFSLDVCDEIKPKSIPMNNYHYNGHVLVVDDVETNRIVASMSLKKMGLTCDTANSGQQAIEAVQNNTYDIVFMDIHMPELDGFDTTRYIRKKLGDDKNKVPIIAMTASVLSEEKEHCFDAGMNGFIRKPFKLDDFIPIFEKWLEPKKVRK